MPTTGDDAVWHCKALAGQPLCSLESLHSPGKWWFRGVVLSIRSALKAGAILEEQFGLFPCPFQGASLGTGGSWLHLMVMGKWGGGSASLRGHFGLC